MKLCGTCKKEKIESEFGVRSASKDGLAKKCKDCQKQYDKQRLRDPKRMKMRRDYQKTETGKAAHNRAVKKWQESNTVKRAAHILIGNAIRDGKIIKQPCEECGIRFPVHAHHDDYAKPMSVRWLCDMHHNKWHRENGEGQNAG